MRNVLNAHQVDRFVDDLTQQTDRPEPRALAQRRGAGF
jgi:hypothetical protein